MIKKLVSVFLVAVLALCFTACSANEKEVSGETSSSASVSETIKLTDDAGREVEVKSANRVACMIGSFADMWCLAGGKDSIVATADDTWRNFDLNLDESVMNLGEIKEPNLEILLESEPDLVIASTNTTSNVEMEETLTNAGITVVYYDVQSFDDYLRVLDSMTDITGDKAAFETNGTKIKEKVDAAKALSDGSKPTVCCLRVTSSSVKAKGSDDSVLSAITSDLDCVNIADEYDSLLENLSLETIMEADPEYIFVVYHGPSNADSEKMLNDTLLSNPAWNTLSAVKNGNYHVLDYKLYNLKPNAEWGTAYEQLAEILYK
ncbi:MAG: ABC transporter substrate-binding protein [Clostridia bacterium]|nr:ABC transporter substrate-binding protein [Clostridia bacterium]